MPTKWPKSMSKEKAAERARTLALCLLRDLFVPLKDIPTAESASQFERLAKLRLKATDQLVKLALGRPLRKAQPAANEEEDDFAPIAAELMVLDPEDRKARMEQLVEEGVVPPAAAPAILTAFEETGLGATG